MKKIILLLLGLCLCYNVQAAELPTFVVGSSNALRGEEITIPVSIEHNAGFTFIGFKLTYDTDSLEYIDGTIKNLDNFQIKQVTQNDNKRIVFYSIALSNDDMIKDDITLLELKFKVLENAVKSDITIEVTDYGDADLNQFKYTTKDGTISIIDNVYVGESKNLNLEEEKNVHFESSDEKLATVDKDGNVTFKGTGQVTISKKDKKGKTIDTKTYNIQENEIERVVENVASEEPQEDKEDNTKIIVMTSFFILIIVILIIVKLVLVRRKKV